VQVVIALIVTPEGFPLAYEVLPGNTGDNTTLRAFLHKVESQYGRANCIWIMDRGIPTEEVLAEMRRADPPVSCLVGTPKGRLAKLEQALLGLPWLPRAVTFCCNQMAELTRLDWHSCQTENEVPPKPVVQKRRGKPPNPWINSVYFLCGWVPIWTCSLSIGVA
jgi:hypothetical protein